MNDVEMTNSILDNSISLGTDLAEIAIDGFLQDGTIIKDIPIAGSIYSIFKIGMTIRDAIFAKNIMVFLQECKNKDSNYEKRQNIKQKFNFDENYRIKVTETTIVYLNRVENSKKAKKMARLFVALCEESISYEEYELYAKIVEDLTSFDDENIKILLGRSVIPSKETAPLISLGTISRLRAYVLIDSDQKKGELIKSERDVLYSFTENGKKFATIITN